MHELIVGDGLVLRPTTPDDLEAARRLFTDPDFYEYWDGYPKPDEEIEAKFLGHRRPTVECLFVEVDGDVVGFTEHHLDEDRRGGGIDLVLLPAFRGQGIGRRVVHALADFVVRDLRWTSFTVDPEVGNERAINFWSNVGFKPLRVVDGGGKPPYWHMEWPVAE